MNIRYNITTMNNKMDIDRTFNIVEILVTNYGISIYDLLHVSKSIQYTLSHYIKNNYLIASLLPNNYEIHNLIHQLDVYSYHSFDLSSFPYLSALKIRNHTLIQHMPNTITKLQLFDYQHDISSVTLPHLEYLGITGKYTHALNMKLYPTLKYLQFIDCSSLFVYNTEQSTYLTHLTIVNSTYRFSPNQYPYLTTLHLTNYDFSLYCHAFQYLDKMFLKGSYNIITLPYQLKSLYLIHDCDMHSNTIYHVPIIKCFLPSITYLKIHGYPYEIYFGNLPNLTRLNIKNYLYPVDLQYLPNLTYYKNRIIYPPNILRNLVISKKVINIKKISYSLHY